MLASSPVASPHKSAWLPLLCVVAAFGVRLHWNLAVHPVGDYLYSDMGGYFHRAQGLVDHGMRPAEYAAFYPYGTHALLAAIMAVAGRDNSAALGIVYALLGAGIVGFTYGIARRVSQFWIVPPLCAAILIAYYPLISLGGYLLSEVPFGFCLTAMTYFVFRMVERGHWLDAVAAGTAMALGFAIRPQILISAGLLAMLWLFARPAAARVGPRLLAYAAIPLLAIMAISAVRFHYHTGRYGLISENGRFNQVFGRCHNTTIVALPDSPSHRRTSFGPPPLLQLEQRAKTRPGEFPQLDPAMGPLIEYRGYIGDRRIHTDLVRRCVSTTGWIAQVKYSVVHLFLLWRYNTMWPDSGKVAWRGHASLWGMIVANVIAVPSLVGLLAVFRPRRWFRHAIVAIHGWAILAVAALYFGDVRLRSPYDPFFVLLAIETLALSFAWIGGRFARRRMRISRG